MLADFGFIFCVLLIPFIVVIVCMQLFGVFSGCYHLKLSFILLIIVNEQKSIAWVILQNMR